MRFERCVRLFQEVFFFRVVKFSILDTMRLVKSGLTFFLGAKMISWLLFLAALSLRKFDHSWQGQALIITQKDENSLLPFHAKDGRFSQTAHCALRNGQHSVAAHQCRHARALHVCW